MALGWVSFFLVTANSLKRLSFWGIIKPYDSGWLWRRRFEGRQGGEKLDPWLGGDSNSIIEKYQGNFRVDTGKPDNISWNLLKQWLIDGLFPGGEDLRQGNPVSPLIFVIATDYLCRAVRVKGTQGAKSDSSVTYAPLLTCSCSVNWNSAL
ncbi:conserved hypothetical protein [Ricinus communis]|uniref:Reverse transcriptase domain-containing protein n=1 Tax=Ricinus communis TaxID=3988 RepID=B9S9M4_RICCO|nr:conserved hypothetical protein [Ricinus communis]